MPVIIKYYPEDVGEEYGSLGIKFPMNARGDNNSGVFNVSYTTEEQAISNYINLLMTRKSERYMQPDFGVGLPYRLFEPNTESLRVDIEFEITTQAAIWLPYIFNRRIDVVVANQIPSLGADVEHGIQIIIEFTVTQSGANRTISVFNTSGVTNVEVF